MEEEKVSPTIVFIIASILVMVLLGITIWAGAQFIHEIGVESPVLSYTISSAFTTGYMVGIISYITWICSLSGLEAAMIGAFIF